RGAGPGLSFLLSAFVVSFLFAVVHPQGFVAIPALMSLAFGFAIFREWRGSLLPCMVAHGISNGLMLLLAGRRRRRACPRCAASGGVWGAGRPVRPSPPACLLCRRPLAASADRDDSPLSSFCPTCAAPLTGDGRPVCPRCAATVGPHVVLDEGCGVCRGE